MGTMAKRRKIQKVVAVALAWLALSFLTWSGRAQTQFDTISKEIDRLTETGKYREALPLAERALQHAEQADPDGISLTGPLLKLGEVLNFLDRQSEAERHERRAVELSERWLGPDHPDTAIALVALGESLAGLDKPDLAEAYYKKALVIQEKVVGPEHNATATTLRQIGQLYTQTKRYAEAEVILGKVLAIRQKLSGADHIDVAIALYDLAFLLQKQGRFSEATDFYQRDLAISLKIKPNHLDTAMTAMRLAESYRAMNRAAEALPLFRQALAIREAVLESDDLRIGNVLYALAEVSRELGRPEEAILFYQRELAILERAHGKSHTDLAPTLVGIAKSLRSLNRSADAEPLLNRALGIREAAFGRVDVKVGWVLNQLGKTYLQLKQYNEAEAAFMRELGIMEKALGSDDVEVSDTLVELADLYRLLKRFEEAERLLKRSLEIRENKLGREKTAVGTILYRLGLLYEAQNRLAEAEDVLTRDLAITEKVNGPSDPEIAPTLAVLARINAAQRAFPKASIMLERAIHIKELELGLDDLELVNWLSQLLDLRLDEVLSAGDATRVTAAEPISRRIIDIKGKAFGLEDPRLIEDLVVLANILVTLRRFSEAEVLLKRARAIGDATGRNDDPKVLRASASLGRLYVNIARYEDAEPILLAVAHAQEGVLGREYEFVAESLSELADIYIAQRRMIEAEALLKRLLSIRETNKSRQLEITLGRLGKLYLVQERFTEAEPLFLRALNLANQRGLRPPGAWDKEMTSDRLEAAMMHLVIACARAIRGDTDVDEHLRLAGQFLFGGGPAAQIILTGSRKFLMLEILANIRADAAKYREAEQLLRLAVAAYERADATELPRLLAKLGSNLTAQSRFEDAKPYLDRALRLDEQRLGGSHPDIASTLRDVANFYLRQGLLPEAEIQLLRAHDIYAAESESHQKQIVDTLHELGSLYRRQGRIAASEGVLNRALAISQTINKPVDGLLNSLALVYHDLGRHDEAEIAMRQVLASAQVRNDNYQTAIQMNNLAGLYRDKGRLEGVEELYKQALRELEQSSGDRRSTVISLESNLATWYRAHGRFSEAEDIFNRALQSRQQILGSDHPELADSYGHLGSLYAHQARWGEAAEHWYRSTRLLSRYQSRVGLELQSAPTRERADEILPHRDHFVLFARATYRAQGGQGAARAFESVQQANRSEAAKALSKMALRAAANKPEIATLVRELQDLVSEWRELDGARVASIAQEGRRENWNRKGLQDRMATINARLETIDKRIKENFNEFTALNRSESLSIAELQRDLLAEGEALVLFFDVPSWRFLTEETLIWVVTKNDVRWLRSELGTTAIAREVAALRCGLDPGAWRGDDEAECQKALNVTFTRADVRAAKQLPFDAIRAHKLYTGLFGEVEELLKDKHLLLVPSGALTALPFQVLVTKEPALGAPMKDIAWLVREHAVTVLPSVSSLKALRRNAKARPSAPPKLFVGFGSPLLTGYDAASAPLIAVEDCAGAALVEQITSLDTAMNAPGKTLGTWSDIEDVRRLEPVPGTASLLCNVAKRLGVPESDIHIGPRATETAVKHMSESGRLKDYRIVHFATHGLVAGELKALAEPALALTPPPAGTSEAAALARDNGLLTASEVAALQLDADWVILSACNTAGPAGAKGTEIGAEALSGLARAFFYAGARSLLVSHWYVEERAAQRLATLAIEHQAVGRAEALRRAMLVVIDTGTAREAHPAYWAPFVVVGEGATQ